MKISIKFNNKYKNSIQIFNALKLQCHLGFINLFGIVLERKWFKCLGRLLDKIAVK